LLPQSQIALEAKQFPFTEASIQQCKGSQPKPGVVIRLGSPAFAWLLRVVLVKGPSGTEERRDERLGVQLDPLFKIKSIKFKD
jgi:hypothetical protein